MRFRVLASLIVLAVGGALAFSGCVGLNLTRIDTRVNGPEPRPGVLGAFADDPAVDSARAWRERRAPALRRAFQDHVYGAMPPAAPARLERRTVLDAEALEGAARLEAVTLAIGEGADAVRLDVALLTPTGRAGPHPLIVAQTFCSTRAAIGHPAVELPLNGGSDCDGGFAMFVIKRIFGEYIVRAPLEDVIGRGYAYAAFHPGQIAPDSAARAEPFLQRLSPAADEDRRTGALAAWAWAYARAIDYFETRDDIDPERLALWGHSRYGKAALLAGAFDPRVDLVISHQSGTGGATLSRSYVGESVKQITDGYPHWFGPAYAAFADREDELPVDQHQLIALLAPRPVMLGNARRDGWSDPNGAYRAAMGADPAYELHGAAGLDQEGLRAFNPDADIAFFLRGGGHGVTARDWEAFLTFLDAQFGPLAD